MPSTLRGRLDRTFKLLICEAFVGAAGVVALFFFSLAAYEFLSEKYSAMVAALVLGGAYMVLTLVALIWLLIWLRLARQREEASRVAAGGAAQLLQDPVVLSTGLEVLRALGSRKATPIAAVVLAGVLIAASRFNAKSKPSQSGSKTGN